MAGPFETLEPRLQRLSRPAPGGREVLFLPGSWHGAWYLEDLARRIAARGHGVSLLELPGHGGDRWELPAMTSIKDYTELAGRAAASLSRPVLVGHSMGGWIAQKILEAVDLPAVLLAPLTRRGLPPSGLLRLILTLPGQTMGLPLGLSFRIPGRKAARKIFFLDPPPDLESGLLEDLSPEPARVCLELGLGLVEAATPRGGAPRLILVGGRDVLVRPWSLKRLAGRLGARLIILPGLPHHFWLEDREGRTAELIGGFLEDLGPA